MASQKKEYFTIRQIIEITGLSEFTLRGWENRYQAFTPKRTDTGRRLYTLQDIEKARLLDELISKGHRIGDIAGQSLKSLKELAATSETLSPSQEETAEDKFLKTMMGQAQLFQWDEIKDLLDKKRKGAKAEPFIQQTLMPLVSQMTYLVGEGQFTIAQEHIFSALIKEQLVLMRGNSRKAKTESRLVITTPEGDLHDMGIVIAATLAADRGVRTLFLGPSTPKTDLCESCIRYKGTHLLISNTVSETEGAKESLYSFVNFLDKNLPKKVHLIIAGRNTHNFKAKLERPVSHLKTMDEFIQLLKNLE